MTSTTSKPKANQPKVEKPSVLYLRTTKEHEAALDAYIQRQKAKPDRQAVGLAALEAFLEQEGLWPPGGQSKPLT